MRVKSKLYQILLCVAAWVLTAFAAGFGYSFLSGTSWSFPARYFVGLLLMCAPLAVTLLIFQLYRKEK